MRNRYPPGWDARRVRRVIKHYDSQTEKDAAAEDEAFFGKNRRTVMRVPLRLVPKVRQLIARHDQSRKRAGA